MERKEQAAFRPFCSKRCKLVDLGRWLDGTYSITEPLPEAEQQTNPLDTESQDGDSQTCEA